MNESLLLIFQLGLSFQRIVCVSGLELQFDSDLLSTIFVKYYIIVILVIDWFFNWRRQLLIVQNMTNHTIRQTYTE